MGEVLNLVDEIGALKAECRRVQELAEKKGALSVALGALDRRLKVLELQVKIVAGEPDEPRLRGSELHLHLSEQQATRVAEVFLSRHRALPTEGGHDPEHDVETPVQSGV